MNNRNDISEQLGLLYHPKSALVFYQSQSADRAVYVEHFDMDGDGIPVNAHPLTVREAQALAKALVAEKQKQTAFLKSEGIMPSNILHITPSPDRGAVIWYTKPQQRTLHFIESLGIGDGRACLPAMIWQATRNSLRVFAVVGNRRPTEKTPLCHAPLLNIYEDGRVCMGSVSIRIKTSASLEEFTGAWEDYFFNSYFSHLIGKNSPVKGSCISLWKDLIASGRPFPAEVLKKNSRTLKSLLP
ncbi:PRTRC system protein B [Flavobacterium plurextorum]|uniref:PRTRC system protein B n=1 Tax=Flavobacterium TaxID=237 RepID=UPI00351A0B6E